MHIFFSSCLQFLQSNNITSSMKGFRKNSLLNLLTRREPYRLARFHVVANPVARFREHKKSDLRIIPISHSIEALYRKIEYELEPFYFQHKRSKGASPARIPKRGALSPMNRIEAATYRENNDDNSNKLSSLVSRLRIEGLSLPIIQQLREYVALTAEKGLDRPSRDFEDLAKSLSKYLISASSIPNVEKEQCYELIQQIQLKLYHYHLTKRNRPKLKECSYRLMQINKKLTKRKGAANLQKQMFWTLEYGHHSEKSKDISSAYKHYSEVFTRENDVETKVCADLKKDALFRICRILIHQKDMKSLKKYLFEAKENQNELYYSIIYSAIKETGDQRVLDEIKREESPEREQVEKQLDLLKNALNSTNSV